MTEAPSIRGKGVPLGTLTPEINFACESAVWREINERLRREAPNEACVFALSRPSHGHRRTTVIVRDLLWPLEGEVVATPYSLEISPDYITRALDAAIDAGDMAGVVMIHTHPDTKYGKGRAFFSARDDWYEDRLFPTITLGRPQAISGSIVLGSDATDVDARIWWNNGAGTCAQLAHVIRVVGPEITFFETRNSEWKDHPDPEVMDRSTRLWGREGRRRLQNLRIGIVGAGGTGSIALYSLATTGVGKIQCWDKDVIKKENLHRMLGATETMLGQNKALALTEAAKLVATAEPSEIKGIPIWGTSEEGLRGLKDCDIVLCCVDRLAPRVPLNDFAYAHLVPVIDMASWIHQTKGVVDAIMTHAHVWSPGIPCAWCRQTLTSMGLMREAQGDQANIEHRVPYGLPLEQTDGVEPSVLALNLAGVGLALLQFLQVALKITNRTPRDLKLFLPEWELDESDLNSAADCSTEQQTGFGDAAKIVPVQGA